MLIGVAVMMKLITAYETTAAATAITYIGWRTTSASGRPASPRPASRDCGRPGS
jgi:hypothetical protein